MNRMNRRDFLTVLGGISAATLSGVRPALAAENTTTFYVRGLVMVSTEDPQVLRLGFPKAYGHNAVLSVTPENGTQRTLKLKGHGAVETPAAAVAKPKYVVPEIVNVKEFYGDGVHSKIEECPTIISIPYSAIVSVKAHEVTKDKWTFVRADNGQEINTFRPRKVAESLQIELSSSSVLKLDSGKVSIPLGSARELSATYAPAPKNARPDMITDHFVHYFDYLERPPAADFLVTPKKLTGNSSTTPNGGNNFVRIEPWVVCFMVLIQ